MTEYYYIPLTVVGEAVTGHIWADYHWVVDEHDRLILPMRDEDGDPIFMCASKPIEDDHTLTRYTLVTAVFVNGVREWIEKNREAALIKPNDSMFQRRAKDEKAQYIEPLRAHGTTYDRNTIENIRGDVATLREIARDAGDTEGCNTLFHVIALLSHLHDNTKPTKE